MLTTFQDRIEIVIQRAGGQSALARAVSELLGERVSQQAIQNLASRRAKKPARSSKMNAAMATAAGVRPQWLEYGAEPMTDPMTELDAATAALILAAAQKLAAPTLDDDVRNNVLGALRLVAKQEPAPYK